MALIERTSKYYEDPYLIGLSNFISSISPALEENTWTGTFLQEVFQIEDESALFNPRVRSKERRLSRVLFEFSDVPEPYKTELKAFLAWRLAKPQCRSFDWQMFTARLIPFCIDLATSANAAKRLIDYGHPIEDGNGRQSTPLREIMEGWLARNGYSLLTIKTNILKTASDGNRIIEEKTYVGANSMPANDLLWTLVLLREKSKPLRQRNIILLEDLYPPDEIPQEKRAERYIHFYRFRLPWMREAARAFVLDKIEHKGRSASCVTSFVYSLTLAEQCLFDHHSTPEIKHVTQAFIEHEFPIWGRSKNFKGLSWYADPLSLIRWACSHLNHDGWPHLTFDIHNRRLFMNEPLGAKIEDRTVPEEVIEQIFRQFDTLPALYKRMLILVRYTGMRALELHSLIFDCMKPDLSDDRFMLLSFWQPKVGKWNTKPLLKEDAAHALVIQAIKDQRQEAIATWGRETKYLFPVRSGDGETHVSPEQSRSVIGEWIVTQDIRACLTDSPGGLLSSVKRRLECGQTKIVRNTRLMGDAIRAT
jgi:hypothetical protein